MNKPFAILSVCFAFAFAPAFAEGQYGDMNNCVKLKVREAQETKMSFEYWAEIYNNCHAPLVEGKLFVIEKVSAQTFKATDIHIAKTEYVNNLGSGDHALIHGKVFKRYKNSRFELKLGTL